MAMLGYLMLMIGKFVHRSLSQVLLPSSFSVSSKAALPSPPWTPLVPIDPEQKKRQWKIISSSRI
jgi:hypothetical protein